MRDTKSQALFSKNKQDNSLFVDRVNLTHDDSVERIEKASAMSLITGLS